MNPKQIMFMGTGGEKMKTKYRIGIITLGLLEILFFLTPLGQKNFGSASLYFAGIITGVVIAPLVQGIYDVIHFYKSRVQNHES